MYISIKIEMIDLDLDLDLNLGNTSPGEVAVEGMHKVTRRCYMAGALRNLSVEAVGAQALNKYHGAINALNELKTSNDSTTARYSAALLKNLAVVRAKNA